MKAIKFLSISVWMLVLGISIASCGGEDYETHIHELLIEKNYTFESDDESGDLTKVIKFRNEDLSYYSVSSDADWCKVAIDPAALTITIKVQENQTFDDRQATITIQDIKDGVSSRTFNVIQKQNDVVRLADKNTYAVATNGGKVTIDVESNISYSVQIPSDVDWITVPASSTRGLVKSQVVLEVAKNKTEKERSAQIYIVDENGGKIPVLISQEFVPYLNVSNLSYTLDENGGEISVDITTNISFDFYTVAEDTWVKAKGGREVINDSTIRQTVSIARFEDKARRRSSSLSVQYVVLNKMDGQYSLNEYTISIIQTRNLYIEESNIYIMRGEYQRLSLVNYDRQDVVWKSSDEDVATVDKNGNVSGVGAGTATITVTSADGLHTDNAKVTVEKPADLSFQISGSWQPTFTSYEGISVLTHLDCTITNNSDYELAVNLVRLYRDNVEVSANVPHEEQSLAPGRSMLLRMEIPAEKTKDSTYVQRDTTYTEDSVMVIKEKEITIPGEYKVNIHSYTYKFDYFYSIDKDKESFTYETTYNAKSESVIASRRKYARRSRR